MKKLKPVHVHGENKVLKHEIKNQNNLLILPSLYQTIYSVGKRPIDPTEHLLGVPEDLFPKDQIM